MTARHHRSNRLALLPWRSRMWLSLAAFSVALLTFGGPVRAQLLQPTPLILKDGRIASVSVHVLPFSSEQATMAEATSQSLVRLTRELATDCFLTAQVIGHVGSNEVKASDTLAAHRLARSRADAVQTALIDTGLPAKSIASVWDWQFMVLEPRATLWVFELTRGEDCEGTPLTGAAGLVASNEPAPAVAADGSDRVPAIAEVDVEAPAPAASAAGPGRTAVAAEAPEPAPPGPAAPAAAGTSRSNTDTPSMSASSSSTPSTGATSASRRGASVSPPGTGRSAVDTRPAVAPPGQAWSSAPAAVQTRPTRRLARATPETPPAGDRDVRTYPIVFGTNSSYFPAGTREQLETLVRGLEAGRRYRVELVASVSGAPAVVGASNPDEAARYNKWLASRRIERVKSWLDLNAADKDLVIEPQFRQEDDSRQVIVRISPAGMS